MHNEIFNLLRSAVFGIIIFMVCCFCAAEKAQWEDQGNERDTSNTVSAAEREEPTETLVKIPEDKHPETEPTPDDTPETELTPEEPPKYVRYPLTDEERTIIEALVAAEALGEGFVGQCLVAQCVLNSAEAEGKRPTEVIYQPGQYTTPNFELHAATAEAVSAVFDDGYQVTTEPIRFFYAPKYCYSEWHEECCEFVLEYGGHRFFKAK